MKRTIASSFRGILSAAAVFTAATAYAGVTITPIYDATFQANPALQATVNNALAIYSSNMGNNLTLPINFAFSSSITGAQSDYSAFNFTYTQYRAALLTNATTANDATVLANLSTGSVDPVIGGTNIAVPTALGLALGLSGTQANYGTVTFNTATYSSNPAGFLGVIQHEINEVLGTASSLPNNTGTATLPTTIAPADLFRYSSGTARSFSLNLTSDPTNKAFFRLSPGGPNLHEFNNLPNGGDYADWAANGSFAAAPQDWSGPSTVFTSMAISPAELNMLDAVGYNAFPVPEPGTVVSLCSVALGWLAVRRRQHAGRVV
jgi:hypothetical protein